MTRHRIARFAWTLAAVALLGAPASAKEEPKRYGLEGQLVQYDAAKGVFKLKVVGTNVGGFGGNTAGAPAPKSIKAGDTLEMQVVPEGSVLKRTVIKGSKGGGLDNTGTKEGFARAVGAIPTDRPVVISFEENASAAGASPYVIRMVQIRMSPEEIEKRMKELGIDPAEAAQVEQPEQTASESAE